MRRLLTILCLITLFAFNNDQGRGLIFVNIGLLQPISEGYLIKHMEAFQLNETESGSFEANFVFRVQNSGNFAIGINSHNLLIDYNILLVDHIENKILVTSDDFSDAYTNLNYDLEENKPYRVVIIGSGHEKNRSGEIYIKQRKPESL